MIQNTLAWCNLKKRLANGVDIGQDLTAELAVRDGSMVKSVILHSYLHCYQMATRGSLPGCVYAAEKWRKSQVAENGLRVVQGCHQSVGLWRGEESCTSTYSASQYTGERFPEALNYTASVVEIESAPKSGISLLLVF